MATVRRYVIILPALLVAGLLAYKGRTSVRAIQAVWSSGALATRGDVVAFDGAAGFITAAVRSIHYFAVIGPALVFGILIGAAVRAFVPRDGIARFLSAGTFRAQLAAGAAGAPLMLCSCCITPVFRAVYERSSRLGPSMAVMLASPSLNPAALVLTFMLFAPGIAAARVLMAVAAVCLSGVIIESLFGAVAPLPLQWSDHTVPSGWHEAASAFLQSLWHMLLRTMPALVLGVVCSMLLLEFVPGVLFAPAGFSRLAVIATASVAVPLALPTFFEIPLALGLLAAGAPAGAAAALLFAGPAINLPSLLALAKSTNWRIAAILAIFIWSVAVAGGLLVT